MGGYIYNSVICCYASGVISADKYSSLILNKSIRIVINKIPDTLIEELPL